MNTHESKLAAAQAALTQAAAYRAKTVPEADLAIANAIIGARDYILDQCPLGSILRPVAEDLVSQAEELVIATHPGVCSEAAYLAMKTDDVIGEALWKIASHNCGSLSPMKPFRDAAAAAATKRAEAISLHERAEKHVREVAEAPEKERQDDEAKAAKETAERLSDDLILQHLTPSEQFLSERGRLNVGEVRSRLRAAAAATLETALAKCPKPGRIYTGSMQVISGHSYAYERKQWQPSWVRTVRFIEGVTGHPVASICEDCIDLNTHVSVAWNAIPVEMRVRFYRPATPETDGDDDQE